MSKVILDLEGMTCASCALNIEKSLKKSEGVKNVVVNFATERATVDGDNLDYHKLINAVKEAGYGAQLKEIEYENLQNTKVYDVKGMSCAACAINVEKALKKVPGVLDANVNIATEKASVKIDPTSVSERAMFKAVSDAGYELLLAQKNQLLSQNNLEKKLMSAKQKMNIAVLLTLPLTILMYIDMLNIIKIPYFSIISLILAFFVDFVIGIKPIKSGFSGLLHRSFNMDVLIMLGVCASYLSGILSVLKLHIADYSAISAMIMSFYLIGQYLEAKAKGKAQEAIKKLLDLTPKKARIVDDNGNFNEILAKDLRVGDVVLVKPSEQIPADGIIIEGQTTVDESMVTGEFLPKFHTVGNGVIGSCINQTGAIKIRVTSIGEDTFLSQIVKLIEDAQGTKVPIQAFADKVVGIFVPFVLVISVFTFIFWLAAPNITYSIMLFGSKFLPWVNPNLNVLSAAVFASVATLVVACPCALGLATPTALMVGSGLGAANGILIRSGEALETAKDINAVVFDKTGTITLGIPKVSQVYSKLPEDDFLKICASLETYSEHPLAKTIINYAKSKNIQITTPNNVKVEAGLGLEGIIDGKKYFIGSLEWLQATHQDSLAELLQLAKQNGTLSVLFSEDELLGAIAFEDTIKSNAKVVINELKLMGIKTVMLTGDNQFAANSVASVLGIDEVKFSLLPNGKIDEIKKLQSQGYVVAMIGDGINDAAALKQSNVGIAIGTGTDIAKESSDITLIRGDLEGVIKAIKLSKATFKKIRQNLFWAFFYNIIGIPIAAMGFLHPAIAEAAMAASSVNVVTNSLRLKRMKL